jgi:hypothetical protein
MKTCFEILVNKQDKESREIVVKTLWYSDLDKYQSMA